MIPPFDAAGNLPPGIHWATWDEIVARFGQGASRQTLLDGLADALAVLIIAGCSTVYIDGSFVTNHSNPADVDVVWDVQGVVFQRLDPVFFARGADRFQQRLRFGCELFPSDIIEASTGLPFVEFFQLKSQGGTKGIIALDLRRSP